MVYILCIDTEKSIIGLTHFNYTYSIPLISFKRKTYIYIYFITFIFRLHYI